MGTTILGLPINRFVVFVKPWINLAAGIFAAWLVANVDIISLLGVGVDQLATQIAAGLSFAATTGLLQLADLKWIKGHHLEIANGAVAIRDVEDELDDLEDDAIPEEYVGTPEDDPASIPEDEGNTPISRLEQ